MKRTLPKSIIQLCFTIIAGISVQSAFAFSLPVVDLVNYAENYRIKLNTAKNLARQATQIENQVKYINNQKTNLKKVGKLNWRTMSDLIDQSNSLARQGQGIAASMREIDKEFGDRFPDYVKSGYRKKNFQEEYQNWSGTTLDTLRNSMNVAGVTTNNYKTEAQLLENLKSQCKTASGRMQVLQVTSQISAENVNQLQALKQLVVAQTNSQNAYMAYRVSKDSYQEKGMSEVVKNINTDFPKYHNDSRFGKISKIQ